MSKQAIWLIVLLGLSTVFGLYRRRTEGRIKLAKPSASPTAQRNLIAKTSNPDQNDKEAAAPQSASVKATRSSALQASINDLKFGQALGTDATLVQFSSAFCQPCRATRLILEDVAASTPGVEHIEIDAEAHLDLVREMGVTRTPTTFILNGQGDIVGKSVGLPKRLEVMNVVEAVTASA
jgi:thiol-disulfide isomerase/thioredoxin